MSSLSSSRGWARSIALLALLALLPCSVVAARDSTPVGTSKDSLPYPLPTSARCPWISRGVVDAAQKSPLVRALVQRTRMAAPFGPGSWPERFTVPEPGDDVFGWTDAVIFSATVRIDPDRANSWLPRPLLRVANDTARVFVAWYERLERQESRSHDDTSAPHTNNHFHLLAPDPLRTRRYPDSFCCGAYHEAAIVFDVEHTTSGASAMHCPWMLVDSDRSMIAGREVLGFPKKLGDFAFRVDGADVSDAAFDAAAAFRPGARITAKVTRGGVALVEMSGTVSDTPLSDNNTIFPGRRNVFLNAATSHPLPPENPDAPDGACLGNRPRLLQFVFDEIAMDGATWRISDADVSLRETKTDAILRPFPKDAEDEDEDVRRLEVLDASAGVTNLYTGEEGMPTLGETIPGGYVENDEVYWLRYQ